MNWIENTLSRVYARIYLSVDVGAQSLAYLRVLFGLYFLFMAPPLANGMRDLPQGFFNPPELSLANLFNGFPPGGVFIAADILRVLCVLCIALGIRARVAGISLVLLTVLANSFVFSFGKIDHGDILPIAAIACLSFSGWSSRFALLPDRPVSDEARKLSLAVFALIICFAMFTAGFEKAQTWVDLDLSTNGFLSWFYRGYYDYGRDALLAPIVFHLPPLAVELFDYSAVAFELSGLAFLLLGRRFWVGWLTFACFFHLANAALLNIAFVTNALTYLVFMSPANLPSLSAIRERRVLRGVAIVALVGALPLLYRAAFDSSPGISFVFGGGGRSGLLTAMVLWPVLVALGIATILRPNKDSPDVVQSPPEPIAR